MDIFDKIFVINLCRRKDRRTFMKYKLEKESIYNYDIIPAIDGYTENIIKIFDMYKNIKYYYGIITSPGAIGLICTWKELLKSCIDNNLKRILILEDDIYFHKDFASLHKNNLPLYTKYNVVTLGGNQPKWDNEQITQIENNNGYYNYSSNKWYCTYGTYGISLDNIAIKIIYDEINKDFHQTTMTIDVTINSMIRNNKISAAVMFPNIILPEMRDSDNMGTRNMEDMTLTHKWTTSQYKYIKYYDEIIRLRNNHINPRHDNTITIGDLSRHQLLRLYDGGQLPFVFIIPSYNNSKWVKKNIMSVINQEYYNWRAIFVDDCSEDNTFEKAKKLVNNYKLNNSFLFINNTTRKYQTHNRYVAYMSCQPEEICVFVDGDDWLAHDSVLKILNDEYTKHNLLVSYGQFAYFDNNRITVVSGKYEFPKDIVQNNSYRKYNWISQHLRTVKAEVLQSVPMYQLQDDKGEWLTKCSDMAEMFGALEHSNGRHKNIGSLLYIYNKDSSVTRPNSYYNDSTKDRDKLINYIRSHPIPDVKNIATDQFVEFNKLPVIAYTADYKHNYQIEFSQRETFVVPCDFHVSHYVFQIYVTVVDNHEYTFSIDSHHMFRLINSMKSKDDEYTLYIVSASPFSEISTYKFNIYAHCTTCLTNNISSQIFNVYTYKNFNRVELAKTMTLQIFPESHGQLCEIIGFNKWSLHNEIMLTRYSTNYKYKKPRLYKITIKYNEKILTCIIETYKHCDPTCITS
jgi:glycosyltransferase involved in cell wall biosynthesis